MKKIKFLLILVIIFSLFGCGGSSNILMIATNLIKKWKKY